MKKINQSATSIRTFIGAKDYNTSCLFYKDLGYTESVIDEKMSLFRVNDKLGFYLQDYYVKQWCENSMVVLEIDNAIECLESLKKLNLTKRYKNVKVSEIKTNEHGSEIFMHDPSGVLWHFFQFAD